MQATWDKEAGYWVVTLTPPRDRDTEEAIEDYESYRTTYWAQELVVLPRAPAAKRERASESDASASADEPEFKRLRSGDELAHAPIPVADAQ